TKDRQDIIVPHLHACARLIDSEYTVCFFLYNMPERVCSSLQPCASAMLYLIRHHYHIIAATSHEARLDSTILDNKHSILNDQYSRIPRPTFQRNVWKKHH